MSSIAENSLDFSRDIYSRWQHRVAHYYYIVIINLIVGVWYLHWRIAYSLNADALWLSIPLLLAEIYIYIRNALFLARLWQPNFQQVSVFSQKKQKIQAELAQLGDRLQQINNLTTEVSQAEQFLDSFQLKVQTEPEDIIKVLTWFEALKQSFIPTGAWLECQTVLGEAFDNVVCHAHKTMPKETPIQLKVEIFNNSMIIKIWDYGSGFDLKKYCQQKEQQSVDRYAENGRGIEIISEVADYFSYTRQEDERNCLVILKSFESKIDNEQQDPAHLLGYLYSFYQLMLLSNSQYDQVQNYLNDEKRNIEYNIEQKTKLAQKIFCLYNFFNSLFIDIFSYLVTLILFLAPLVYFYTKTTPFESYDYEFSIHFLPAILLNSITFLIISTSINTPNKWYEKFSLFFYSILGNYDFYASSIKLVNRLEKYKQKNKFNIYLYWVKIPMVCFTAISICWGAYQLISENFVQHSYYLISTIWSIFNVLYLYQFLTTISDLVEVDN